MSKLCCIDRLEEGYAVCQLEDRSSILVELGRFPDGVREGDCFWIEDNGQLTMDPKETQRRRQKASQLLSQLKKRPR